MRKHLEYADVYLNNINKDSNSVLVRVRHLLIGNVIIMVKLAVFEAVVQNWYKKDTNNAQRGQRLKT